MNIEIAEQLGSYIESVTALNGKIEENAEAADLETYKAKVEAERLELMSRIEEAQKPAEPPPPSLMESSNLLKFFDAVVHNRNLDGAERELNQELGLRDSNVGGVIEVPLDLFMSVRQQPGNSRLPGNSRQPGNIETYSDAVTRLPYTDASSMPQPILGRIFKANVADFLGISEVIVSSGVHDFPYVSTGTTAGFVEEGDSLDAGAISLSIETLPPFASTAAITYSLESEARWGNRIINVFENDILGVIGEKMDEQLLNSPGSDTGLGKGLNQRIQDVVIADGDSGSGVDDTEMEWADYMRSLTAHLEDPEIPSENSLRILMGKDTYVHASGKYRSSTGEVNAIKAMREEGVRIRFSAHMPDTIAKDSASGDKQDALLVARPELIVRPVWRKVELVRDTVTNIDVREARITAVMFSNIGAIRSTDTTVYGSRRIQYVHSNKI